MDRCKTHLLSCTVWHFFLIIYKNREILSFHEPHTYTHTQPTHYVTITTRRHSECDTTDSADVERVHLKEIVGQLKNNLYNVAVLSDDDLELLSNMDPNSLADITGKDFMEQLKEVSGRSDRIRGEDWGRL